MERHHDGDVYGNRIKTKAQVPFTVLESFAFYELGIEILVRICYNYYEELYL